MYLITRFPFSLREHSQSSRLWTYLMRAFQFKVLHSFWHYFIGDRRRDGLGLCLHTPLGLQLCAAMLLCFVMILPLDLMLFDYARMPLCINSLWLLFHSINQCNATLSIDAIPSNRRNACDALDTFELTRCVRRTRYLQIVMRIDTMPLNWLCLCISTPLLWLPSYNTTLSSTTGYNLDLFRHRTGTIVASVLRLGLLS
jgi:hypothetical protein